MPIHTPQDAEAFEVHGSRFHSFVRGDRGASTLCAWRLEVAPDSRGVTHRPDREEVLLVLDGRLEVTLDDEHRAAEAGMVIHVPAHGELRVDGGPEGGVAWVTTTRGLTATIGDTTMRPPWAQ